MTTFYIILGLIVAAAAVYFYAIKTGKIKDADGDLIADKAEDIVAEVKKRAKNVKTELGDVKKAAKNLAKQTEDVLEAAAGKKSTRKKAVSKGSGAGAGKKSKGSGAGAGKKRAPRKTTKK